MLKTVLVAAISALAILPAQAAVLQAVYTGTMLTGNDYSGIFGSVGSLDGMSITAAFTYDTNGGVRVTNGGSDRACGGTSFMAPTMILAQISIAGHTAAFPGNHFGCAGTYTPRINYQPLKGDYSVFNAFVSHSGIGSDQANSSYAHAFAYYASGGLPANLDTPYDFDVSDLWTNNSFFDFIHFDGTQYQIQASGYFHINHLTISAGDPTTVFPSDPPRLPLPASFGMGFAALAGLVLMARRHSMT